MSTLTTDRLLIDVTQAAELCAMSRSTFLRLERAGRVGPRLMKLGRLVRIDRRQLEDWISAGAPPRSEWNRPRKDK